MSAIQTPVSITVQITLPAELAEQAHQAGLLAPERLESLFRQQLKAEAFERLSQAMDKISAVNDLPEMSPEEVALEMKTMRAERRTQAPR